MMVGQASSTLLRALKCSFNTTADEKNVMWQNVSGLNQAMPLYDGWPGK